MSFHRHHRRCLDAATSHVHYELRHCSGSRAAFSRLLAIASAQSNLLGAPMSAAGRYVQLEALRNLAVFHRAFLRDPSAWSGAHGHPLVVVESLARHLLGRYPTPRFLASAWFGDDDARSRQHRHWFIAHARGKRFRDLQIPLVMTRKMEHFLVHGPHHLDVTASLRRAEVLGLGGSPELAHAILATKLGRSFAREDLWRPLLELLCRDEAQLDLADVPLLVEFLASRHARFQLGATSIPVLLEDARRWQRGPTAQPSPRLFSWQPSRWRGLTLEVYVASLPPQTIQWEIVELVDSHALVEEGHAMRNCVASYAHKCKSGAATIWSLRRRGDGEAPLSLLTIEVDPRCGAIVQVKGPRNCPGSARALELLRMWAQREQLELRS